MDTRMPHTLVAPDKTDAATGHLLDAVRGCTFDDFLFAPQPYTSRLKSFVIANMLFKTYVDTPGRVRK